MEAYPWAGVFGYQVLLCVTALRKKKGVTKVHTDLPYMSFEEGFLQGVDYDQSGRTACGVCMKDEGNS